MAAPLLFHSAQIPGDPKWAKRAFMNDDGAV